jgi:hypothetical protein
MQNKPNLLVTQMNVTSVKTKYYENKRLCRHGKNKPNQTQFIVSLSNLFYPPPAVSKGTLARAGRTGGEISEHQNIEVSGRRISGKQGIRK